MPEIIKNFLLGIGSVFVEMPGNAPAYSLGGGFAQDRKALKRDVSVVCRDVVKSAKEFRHGKRSSCRHSKTGK